MKILTLLLISTALMAQTGPQAPKSDVYANRPTSPATGMLFIVTDDGVGHGCTGGGTAVSVCRWNGSAWAALSSTTRGISFTFDGGGAAIASGATAYVRVPFACTIVNWSIGSTTAETVTIKLWRVATGGTALPTVSNSISTSGVSLSSGTAVYSATVSDFTSAAVAANDWLAANITAITASGYVNYTLGCSQ